VEATENLIRLAQKKGVKKMVLLSSLAASGPSNGTPRTEADPLEPVSMYGKSKKKMEEMVHRLAGSELSVTISYGRRLCMARGRIRSTRCLK
jgi:dihydroflavonol-4-reductase